MRDDTEDARVLVVVPRKYKQDFETNFRYFYIDRKIIS